MKAFVDWVLGRRARLIIVAVATAPLLSIIAAGLIALETARRGALSGALAGAVMAGGLVLLAWVSRTDTLVFGALGAVCAVAGVASGGLIRGAGNLVLAFQAALLVCAGAVLLIGVAGIDARPLFAPVIAELPSLLPAETPPEEVALVGQRTATLLLTTAVFLQVICTLLVGFWWTSVAAGQRRFGAEFRELRLGRVLGWTATGLIVLGLALDAPVVQNLTLLAMLGFLLQGVAVLHAWAHAKGWHPARVAPVYLFMLIPGVNVLVVLPIGMLGLVDQWVDLRASMRPRT